MEALNVLLITGVSSLTITFLANLLYLLRTKIPKTVQCWFCQCNSKVNYVDSNSWFCSKCEQYNGFSEDGNYNRIIPSQYDEKKNYCVTTTGRKKSDWKKVNSLCETCNHNQNLKIKQLAAFVPLNENRYNEEIEHFREQLEKCYKLCKKCETLLQCVLTNQQNLSGPRKLIAHTINKIQTQGRGILKISLLLSLLLTLTAFANLHVLKNPQATEELKDWLDDNDIYQEWLELVMSFIPNWAMTIWPSVRDLPIVFIFCGALFQTIRCYNHKSMWCLLNWFSWLLLVALSWFPNGYEELVTYMQVIAGSVSFILTSLIIWGPQKHNSFSKKVKPTVMNQFASPTFGKLPRISPLKSFPVVNNISPNPPSLFKPIPRNEKTIDFGISKLTLGTDKSRLLRKQQETPFSLIRPERVNKAGMSPILSPPRLTLNKCEKFNPTFDKPLTSSSSYSSGFVSVSGSLERSNTPSECGSYEPVLDPSGYVTSYNGYSPNGMYNNFTPVPFSPMAYYHFATEYQRMYLPPYPPPALLNSSWNVSCQPNQKTFDVWSLVYLVPILILVASNIALLWTVYRKDLMKMEN